jgi:hypothetical protein
LASAFALASAVLPEPADANTDAKADADDHGPQPVIFPVERC